MLSTERPGGRPVGMAPLLFGAADRRLFGVYHAPQRPPARTTGVVICQSWGHEYIRAHRAMRNLAAALARQGFPVLRFDYYGCGDSGGDAQDVTFAQGIADATAGATELKRQSGARTVAFVGQRYGAAIAVRASADRRDTAGAILLDPVLRGLTYLEGLTSLHASWMQSGGRKADGEIAGHPDAVLGFTLSAALRAELMDVDLTSALGSLPPATVHVVTTEQTAESAALASRVITRHGEAAWRFVNEPAEWDQPHAIHTALASPQVLQCITGLMHAIDTAGSPRRHAAHIQEVRPGPSQQSLP